MIAHFPQKPSSVKARRASSLESQANIGNLAGAEKMAREWQGNSGGQSRALAKNDSRYWRKRVFRPVDGRTGAASPHYSVRIAHGGTRRAISLGTGNLDAAAIKARDIYLDALGTGLDSAVEKFRPKPKATDRIPTIGEWILAAQKVSSASPTTFGQYAVALRLIAGQILAVSKSKKRFAPGATGGASQFRERIESASVSILSPAALQQWRLLYLKKAKTPAEEKSRMTSANSIMKQARCLFSEKILRFLTDIKIPDPLPFAGCEFFPRQNSRYFSRIDPRSLLQKAQKELALEQPAEFLVMLLALSAGLRKGEIDTLCWSQVDFNHALIRVEPTAVASLKSQESRGEVPIDPGLCGLLRSFKKKASGDFVIEAPEGPSGPKKWGRAYRADQVFESLYQWLRQNGVTAQKPLHELRKELGALVTTEHGIYAASRILRHSDISTTTRFYADQKSDATIKISTWLASETSKPSAKKRTNGKTKTPKSNE